MKMKFKHSTSFIILALILTSLSFLYNREGKVLLISKSPTTESLYDANYELRIKESINDIGLFYQYQYVEIMISRVGNEFTLGHSINLYILGAKPELAKVIWKGEGTSIQFDTGHTVIIPRSSFIGGR